MQLMLHIIFVLQPVTLLKNEIMIILIIYGVDICKQCLVPLEM